MLITKSDIWFYFLFNADPGLQKSPTSSPTTGNPAPAVADQSSGKFL